MATPSPSDFEKLGVFYLGREYDLEAQARRDHLVLYDSKDLVTHAVCVGMTGSGKTGLCVSLLEEAAIDGVPAIVIDPKGDLSNLLLTFPNLRAEDFAPWVSADDARRKGLEPAAFAEQQAALWTKGLADWGQDGARIARLKNAAEFSIYTPGSTAGIPVSILRSFDAPGEAVVEDTEAFRERIASTATSLLGLVNIAADPVTSREHILISALLGEAWAKGQSLDIPALIQRIQQPPLQRVGVMDLETFYPSKDRFGLAMALNNLVASPSFSRWTEGQAIDIGAMLYTPQGKPRIAIFSIAHLGDAERMFFVSLLLNQVLGWVRQQSGTSSLRALLYMDEIAGYFPPVANPPSKGPLLTLMKQGRAFGFGCVLATQNPVDLDYKGLANAGTWFIGRLQTERDKLRVLDGLEGASSSAGHGFDRAEMDRLLSSLGSRVFLMNNIHEDGPIVFQTRWALSYLRGPLTREQIKLLGSSKAPGSEAPAPASPAATAAPAPSNPAPSAAAAAMQRPVLPPEVPQYFLPSRAAGGVTYRPMLLGVGTVYYADAKAGIDTNQTASLLVGFAPGPVPIDWANAEASEFTDADLEHEPEANAAFASLPAAATKAKSYEDWKKSFADALFRTAKLELLRSSEYGLTSKPGEAERDFRARLAHTAHEERDAAADKLRAKYAPKLATLQDRIRRAEQAVEVQKQQASAAKIGTALSFGTAILGAFMGRKVVSSGNIGRAASAARGLSRSGKEASDVGRAAENVQALTEQYSALEAEFKAELDELAAAHDPAADTLERITLKPKKTNISVRTVVLAWVAGE